MSTKPILYSYWRSSCAWRVRIALHLKGIEFEQRIVNLFNGDQHKDEECLAKLPFSKVPVFVHGKFALAESMAIIEYLEEKFPEPNALLPPSAECRAQVRALALQIVANTQPLQNLVVLQHLSDDPAKRNAWARHWIEHSFNAFEKALAKTAGKYAYGDKLSLVDICIPPQVYNAKR
uniref:maleylacetoacetate isomerase n=1 Tax=Globodera rostochiensis TaxID=31243 RepID=A0A914IH75_GLORO